MKISNPSVSKDHALRYVKQAVKSIEWEDITLKDFQKALERDRSRTLIAFQQLVFGEFDTYKTLNHIEEKLSRFRGLHVQSSTSLQKHYDLEGFMVICADTAPEYSIARFTKIHMQQLQTDLYQYAARNSVKKTSLLKSIKLLKKSYSEELVWLQNLEQRCVKIFGGKKELTKEEFHKVISYQKALSDKIFNKFDKSQTGTLNVKELYDGLVDILTTSTAGRLRYLFDIYDSDGNGTLNRQEVEDVLSMCIAESSLKLHDDLIAQLLDIVWTNVTENNSDSITFEQFYATLTRFPSVYDNLNINFLHKKNFGQIFRFLDQRKTTTVFTPLKRCCSQLSTHISKNMSLWAILILYFSVSIVLLGERINSLLPRPSYQYWFIVAKGAGQLLNFNISFVLALVLKHTTTKLRKTFVRRFLPFDDMHFLHKMVAIIIMFLGFVHTIAHCINIYANLTYARENFTLTYYIEDPVALFFWTGAALLVLSFVFIITTLPRVKAYSFELFMRTHQVSALAWMLIMLWHGRNFWTWILGPAVLFAGERLYFFIMFISNRTYVESGIVHGTIIQLSIRKPKYFNYHAGDYVNINIPEISRMEWHPFTISSSPDNNPDYFTLHIRKVGDWTGKLHKIVTERNKHLNFKDNVAYVETPEDAYSVHSDASTADTMEKGIAPSTRTHSVADSGEAPPSYMICTDEENTQKSEDDKSKISIKLGDDDAESVKSDSLPSPSGTLQQAVQPLNNGEERKYTPVEKRIMLTKTLSKISMAESDSHFSTSTENLFAKKPYKRTQSGLSMLSRASSRSSIVAIPIDEAARLNWRVNLDGPYATPSHDILNTKHAILVAGGIGVTPFVSVLESVMKLLRDTNDRSRTILNQSVSLKRIDFYWITRDQQSLSWFHQVFREIEEQQAALGLDPPLVNLHIYLTQLKKSEDIRGAFLQLALEMIYQEDSLDVLSGLKAKTKPGRPDWRQELKDITSDKSWAGTVKPSRPKMYACGPTALCDELKKECYRTNISFKEEIF